MSMSNYPNGFTNGVTIRGVPIVQMHPGKVFWVNNSSVLPEGGLVGSDSGTKGTYLQPFASIDYAVGQCTASRGDIIFVMPGYTETITSATDIVMDVAGIAIVGLGIGSLCPTITFGTNNTANIPVTAANISISNIIFESAFLNVASAFTATGTATPTDFTVENCYFRDTGAALGFKACVTGNATANSMDGLNFLNNQVYMLDATAGTTAVSLLKAADHVRLQGNTVVTPALNDTAALATLSTFSYLDLVVSGNKIFRPSTSSTGGTLFSGSGVCTGLVYDNYVWHLDNSTGLMATTGQALGFFNNYCPITAAADKSALINPAAV